MRKTQTLVSLILISLILGNIASSSSSSSSSSASASGDAEYSENLNVNTLQKKHFVLIHGPCFGAWSWYKLIPLLRSHGHTVTAIDLNESGISQIEESQIATMSDYTEPLIDLMASLSPDDKVILVGHSFGGLAIAEVMELYPTKISMAVYLNAIMPGPTFSIDDILPKAFSVFTTALDNKDDNTTGFIFGPQYLSQVVYQFSPKEDAVLATLLVRTLPATPNGIVLTLSPEKYGSIKRVFITSEQDKVIPIQLQEYMIKRNPPNRVERIFGSDHMVMISQTAQLAVKLLAIALQS